MSKVKYDIDAMKKAVDQCDVNIETFTRAIVQEEETKREYQRIVRELERAGNDPSLPKS